MRGLPGIRAVTLLLCLALAPAAAHEALRQQGRGERPLKQHRRLSHRVSMVQLLRHASNILGAGRQGPIEGADPIGPLRKPTESVKYEDLDTDPGDSDAEHGDDDNDGDDDDVMPVQIVGPTTVAPTTTNNYNAQIAKQLKDYAGAVADAQAEWEANKKEQQDIHAELLDIRDDRSFNVMVERKVNKMVNETQTPLVATFLGDMRKETRKWAKPEYEDDLEEQQKKLERQERKLHRKFRAAKAEYDDEFQRLLDMKTKKRVVIAENRRHSSSANVTEEAQDNVTVKPAEKPAEGGAARIGGIFSLLLWLPALCLSPAP